MKVAVTGASGFVGRAVVDALRTQNAGVVALGRHPQTFSDEGIEARSFDPNAAPNPAAFEGVDAVVHLAGESVAGRWTARKKERIAVSRIAGTRTLVASLTRLARPPSVLVSASAVGYYGNRGDERLTEASAPGDDFLARVCIGWETAAREAEASGIRVVSMRTGIALGRGGALAQLLLPFKLLVGGPVGSGRQFVPWIHVADLAGLYLLAVRNDALSGAINAVTPDYATNGRLSRAIGAELRRPCWLPVPPFALRAVAGEFAETLLGSEFVVPSVALEAGFQWRYPQLEPALSAILDREPGKAPRRRRWKL